MANIRRMDTRDESLVQTEATVLSVVVPLCDEEAVLPMLYGRVSTVLEELDVAWEMILVDDGSRDSTWDVASALGDQDTRVRIVRLSRNFGHQLALSAGLEVARGRAVVTMDGDLQHPPEVIPEFFGRWQEGYEVVYGVMIERQGESLLKNVTARLFYRVLRWLADVEVTSAAGDFRLIDRRCSRCSWRCRNQTATCAACSAGSASGKLACPTSAHHAPSVAASTQLVE